MTILNELTVGAKAPDIELANGLGPKERLSTLWRERPLVLVFLRLVDGRDVGDRAVQLRDAYEQFVKAGGALAAVASATGEEVRALRDRWNLPFAVYADAQHDICEQFSLTTEMAGTFVIDTEGTVRFVHRSHSAMDNPTTWSLVDALSEVTGQTVERPVAVPASDETEAPPVPQPGIGAPLNFTCAKCGHNDCEVNDMSATSGMLSRMINLQNRRFSAVTCRRCMYTELYKTNSGALRNVIDVVVGS